MCLGVSAPCPQEQHGEPTPGTLLRWRKAARPVFPVRSWVRISHCKYGASYIYDLLRGIRFLIQSTNFQISSVYFISFFQAHVILGTLFGKALNSLALVMVLLENMLTLGKCSKTVSLHVYLDRSDLLARQISPFRARVLGHCIICPNPHLFEEPKRP